MTPPKLPASLIPLLAVPLLLAACASAPRPEAAPTAQPGQSQKQPEKSPGQAQALPDVELTDELLYELLVGEVAAQRGDTGLAAQTYLDLARTTRDPRVARRAAQLAFEARQLDMATEALKLWLELDPKSQQARQMLISLLVSTGRLEEARPLLAQILAEDQENAGAIFGQLYPMLAREPNKVAVWKLMRDLAHPYPRLAEAHLAVARAAAGAGMSREALDEVRQARALRPDSEEAAMYEVQLLEPGQPQQALAVLKDFLAAYPDAPDARLLYARMLLERKQYRESRAEFQRLLDAHPESAEMAFAVALLSLQMGELDRAEKELQRALTHGKKDQGTVHYYLGELSEAKKDNQAALQHYRKVRSGEYAYPARLREAYLLSSSGKLDEARDLLHGVHAQNDQQKAELLLFEGQLLRDARQYAAAYQVLQQGLEQQPNHPDLLYEAALLADRLGRPEEMEQMLRKLIHLQPDNANAFNALGYSMLERNVRIDEGMQLVEKAYELAPNDAAIMDSMGWGNYRRGNLDKSLEFLQRAYAANPDPEIAAHLGEVLWVHGDKEGAKKVWSGSLKQNPQSDTLQAVMKKFLQ